MADQPLSALSETFQYGYSTADVMLILDVLDTSMWTTGTDKGITVAAFLAQYLHAGSNITLTPGSNGVTLASTASAITLAPTAVQTGNYTASPNQFVPCNTTSGPLTVTLPTAPPDQTQIAVKHIIQGGANTVTVAAAGGAVFNKSGGSTSMTLTLLNQGVSLQYAATPAIWYVLGDDLPLSQTDARYLMPTGSSAGLTGITGSQISGNITGNAASITGSITTSQVSNLSSWAGSTAITTVGTINSPFSLLMESGTLLNAVAQMYADNGPSPLVALASSEVNTLNQA